MTAQNSKSHHHNYGAAVLLQGPMDFFEEITRKTIQERRASQVKQQDFLQLLMEADEESLGPGSRRLSEDEILAQCVLFFSVGFETASQLLMYCAYCLALHPECQEALHDELATAFGDAQAIDDKTLLRDLPYLAAVVDETLRLYNPVLRMERRAAEDFLLGDTGIIVPKGMIIGIPVWALHHTPEYFPKPHVFDPTRFLPENRANIVPSSYLPFGQGPRNCIGERFSMLESKLLLAEMLLRFRFVPTAATRVPLQFVPNGRPLLGPTDIIVGVEAR